MASPVFAGGRVFVAMGQSPEHGNAPSLVHAINPSGQGDVTASRLLWTSRQVGRVVATPIEKDGLLYVGDVGGMVYCLDAATGTLVWEHDTYGAIWGSFLLAGDRLYVGNEDGTMTILRHRAEEGIAGRDRDGRGALLASVADRRCAVADHVEAVVPDCDKALTAGHFNIDRVTPQDVAEAGLRPADKGR